MIFAGDHTNKLTAAKNFFKIIVLLAILILPINSEAKDKKQKDCQYCNKYERMEDWPVSERPKEFVYEEIDYPEVCLKIKLIEKLAKIERAMLEKKFTKDLLKRKQA